MNSLWETLFGLDERRSMWIEPEDLGDEKLLEIHKKNYLVTIPKNINNHIILRLRGLGKKRYGRSGDLYLHLWLNKGVDVHRELWLSESAARNGTDRMFSSGGKTLTMIIPPNCYEGLTIRLKGYGRVNYIPDSPYRLSPRRGNLLVKLKVFPDRITPRNIAFDSLATNDMYLEGWVYRAIDQVLETLGPNRFPEAPLSADEVADTYNHGGWLNIYYLLLRHLKLPSQLIPVEASDSILLPGVCEIHQQSEENRISCTYKISINSIYLDNPFTVAAILAHELCHVIYSEYIEVKLSGYVFYQNRGQVSLEKERTVDLLVFLFKVGEFQLRTARDRRMTLGYFNQDIFERMQAIVSRKFKDFEGVTK